MSQYGFFFGRIFRVVTVLVLFALLSLTMASNVAASRVVRIAAASSLQFALDEIIKNYQASVQADKASPKIQIVYGSSGNLYRQIVQGAPFDILLSADAQLVDRLYDSGNVQEPGIVFGHGRLVLAINKAFSPSSGIDIPAFTGSQTDEAAPHLLRKIAASDGSIRLAIANPAHAPYGIAARQTLDSLGLWAQIKPKLVYGEKVSQAAQFVVSGAIDLAVISHSLALAIDVNYLPLAAEHHEPIVQKMALLASGDKQADQLYSYLALDGAAQAVFTQYGFDR